jgi:DNA helicase-2/ATP-dependent DNA helicase PcrA
MSEFPNSEQRAVIEAMDGSSLVLAPAGTGKTAVMAERLARAADGGMDLGRTLCVTFTNRAAREMRSRVAARLGEEVARTCNIRTFHGLCAWMLKVEARDLGISRDFVIYDEEDCKAVLGACLGKADISPADAFYVISALKSCAFGDGLRLGDVPPVPRELRGLLRPVWKRNLEKRKKRRKEEDPEMERIAFEKLVEMVGAAWTRYHEILAARNALDFSDLIRRVRAMFLHLPEKREKWGRRFDWLQVDEIQDTHQSEYEVIAVLARRTRKLMFFGDLDQTIYEWRGSDPDGMLDRFQVEFRPVRKFSLRYNYRATRSLLVAADSLAKTFRHRHTHITPAESLEAGEPIKIHHAKTTDAEALWIAEEITALREKAGAAERIGILARTHRRTLTVSKALTDAGIEHVTVDEFQFFLRQEIKDMLARLRLLLNPDDTGALARVVRRPASGIGDATMNTLARKGDECGLRLPDLLRPESHAAGEPFAPLLAALAGGTVVVLDVETTGLSPVHDDVIDIGAVRLDGGRETARFECLLHPSRPVGDSEAVHGLSDELLAREGRDPRAALDDLREFIAGAHVVGHNVRFDLSMLKAHGSRVGVEFAFPRWNDTLDIARRLLYLERYHLGALCEHFGTKHSGSHRALADTLATADVLLALRKPLAAGQKARRRLVKKFGKSFRPLSVMFQQWREDMERIRPAELARRVLADSGLAAHYAEDSGRTEHLATLLEFFNDNEIPDAAPLPALEELVAKSALARNIDHLDPDDPKIPVITVHQAKGLEFDVVFIAGATEGEFPSWFAIKERDQIKIDEERRLFYVAVTRAKKRLYISSFAMNAWDIPVDPSRFLRPLEG